MSTDNINNKKNEFRQDIISGDWILVASKREEYSRKAFEKMNAEKKEEAGEEVEKCPFENPQKNGNGNPVLMLDKNGKKINLDEDDWFIQIIPNKNPAMETHYETCPQTKILGPYSNMDALGFHEVVITRDHKRTIAKLSKTEIETLIFAYKSRYLSLADEKCLKYILIFHNSGKEAGASVSHPHSQIMALPIIPPDVVRSLNGHSLYFEQNKKCPHCESLRWELEFEERIIYKNSDFVALCPYASHFNFEIRIFPIKHKSKFEEITESEIKNLADIFKNIFGKIYDKFNNPPYNFFIHTAPINYIYNYHWHIEILPRFSIWGGMELGTGIEVIVISPEKAASILID